MEGFNPRGSFDAAFHGHLEAACDRGWHPFSALVVRGDPESHAAERQPDFLGQSSVLLSPTNRVD
jgi:hypothetical protein